MRSVIFYHLPPVRVRVWDWVIKVRVCVSLQPYRVWGNVRIRARSEGHVCDGIGVVFGNRCPAADYWGGANVMHAVAYIRTWLHRL